MNAIIYNASGVNCTTYDELNQLLEDSYCGAVITKSCSLNYRKGNELPRYCSVPHGSINSMGLPNLGFESYCRWIKENYENKTCFMSITTINLEDTYKMLETIRFLDYITLPEINISCPNIAGLPQMGYDFERTEKFLKR